MEIVSKRKDIALNGLSPNKVGSNHKEQPILSPGCLGRMVAAFTIGAISMETLVINVAALQYGLVSCCLLTH